MLGIIGGGTFVIKVVILDRPDNPQDFVNQALANSLEIESAVFDSSIVAETSGIEGVNGSAALMISGKANRLLEYLPELDYRINLNGSGTGLGQNVNVQISGDLQILDEVFYGKLENMELTGIPSETLALVNTANVFKNKWFALSFKKLRTSDTEIEELFDKQKQRQLEIRENLKDFLQNQDVLLVKKLPLSFGEIQTAEVALNADVLASDIFFEMLENLLDPQLPENAENPFKIDEIKKMEAQRIIRKIAENSNSQITLRIGKKDGILRGYDLIINLNLVDLIIGEYSTGSVKISMRKWKNIFEV